MKTKQREKYLIISDLHVPDHDIKALDLVLKFIPQYQPDYLDILGDFVNFTKISKYTQDPYYETDLADEIEEGRGVLRNLVNVARKANPDVEISFFEGNHEARCQKFLARNAQQLANLTTDDEYVISVPHLFELKKNNVKWVKEERLVQRHGITFFHGTNVRIKSGFAAHANIDKFGTSGFTGHCFDDKTEILTTDGWKKHTELTTDTRVMTMNKTTHNLEWNKINEIHKYDSYKELLEVDAFGLNLAVTPDHGMLVQDVRGRWSEKKAHEVAGGRNIIPLAGHYNQTKIGLEDCWIKLLAWIVTEGNISFYKGRKVDGIRIAQSDMKGRLEKLEQILQECGIDYSKTKRYDAGRTQHGTHRNYDAYRLGLRNAAYIYEKISPYIQPDKELKVSLLQMDSRQSRIFLDSYIDGDGSVNPESTHSSQIATNNLNDIGLLQAISAKCGYRSTISSNGGMFYLTINSRGKVGILKQNWKKIPYSGIVWCVSVDNGTLLVRRNGKTAITLNSHKLSLVTRTQSRITKFWVETGCLCNPIPTPSYTISPDWCQGFATADYENGQWFPQIVPIINHSFMYNGKVFE